MKVPNYRYPLILSSLIAVTALGGCKGDVLDYRNAQLVNGKVYAGNANEPFFGKLTNVPADKLLGQQPGFSQISAAILNTGALIPGDPREAQSLIGSGNAVLLMLTPHAVCDGKEMFFFGVIFLLGSLPSINYILKVRKVKTDHTY
ncbi:hypothetical protein [Burkholderia sp. TSV86]|uniref:hypothetical protein n=1 Tax=Burkholderia sp. TSV86 TaxID=1385594 RepID=UPI000755A90A|nr:hypothetical protein [Burkholderia sp. TSV86]KVE37478.1 hypothetical protein WS68_02660 [Burkholderia sp. TSV86]